MNHFTSIRIEGSIFSSDILEKLDTLKGQKPSDFGHDVPVKDEIARAWADAQDYWRIFQRRVEDLPENSHGTTETRNRWMVPFLSLLGYKPEVQQKGEEVMGRNFAISHRDTSRDGYPIHIMGYRDSLDQKRVDSGPRMSPHGLVQEYLNLKEEYLYAIVTNGLQLRLLRDSSRLVKLSYIEFDLDRMFTDGIFSDFAILYRLLHATRMPVNQESINESLIELYHQDSLDSGSRIRDGLSIAVESSIISFANGFLNHPDNEALRERMRQSKERQDNFETEFYQYQLRLIYRLLFLMVIEERNLVYPDEKQWGKFWDEQPPHIPRMPLRQARDIYYNFYSVARLRGLAGKRYLADAKHSDYWIALKNTFRLFADQQHGAPLGIRPLAGDLFGDKAIGLLNECSLDNSIIIQCLTNLTIFEHPDTHQQIRVNYGALNVEEFGSVYEGLLEYDPYVAINGRFEFSFKTGEGRSSSGSHYTPDELVSPLIKYSLDYLLEDRMKIINAEIRKQHLRGKDHRGQRKKLVKQHLLSLSVCDVACGSGHILLNAARRIATECAVIIEEEEQPSPYAFRKAIREVIRSCIYGVDLNPLAVELCKVALWLEAHNPGEPLNFLDHHIKCGNAIVGLAHKEELQRGIAEEAFKKLDGDDKDICADFRKRNKGERNERLASEQSGKEQAGLGLNRTNKNLQTALHLFEEVAAMPEHTPEEIETKHQAYEQMQHSPEMHSLRLIADIQVAQFYIPKDDKTKIITDAQYFRFLKGEEQMIGQAVAQAMATGNRKYFFHWFIEFPHIMNKGGFDCILGNPPYLGGQALSGSYGHSFCEYVKWEYAPTGLSELIVFFLRRIHSILYQNAFTAFITTNSIKDGDVRKDGLEQVVARGASINFAVRGIKWPGLANLVVSLVAIRKGKWKGPFVLDNKEVGFISSFFEDAADLGEPDKLVENSNSVYQGSIFLGDGFLMNHEKAADLRERDSRSAQVLFPIINGQELNNQPDQQPGRSIINFFDWPVEKAKKFKEPFQIVEECVKPVRMQQKDKGGKEKWWNFLRPRMELYSNISSLPRCFAAAATTKYLNFSAATTDRVFANTIYVFTTDRWDLYCMVQSTLHEVWARKYSGALKQDLRYSPSDCFRSFAFPSNLWNEISPHLIEVGERYHEYRRQTMLEIQLGLTKTYNQFHNDQLPDSSAEFQGLEDKAIAQTFGKKTSSLWKHLNKTEEVIEFDEAVARIRKLRDLHKEMDEAVLAAYGWHEPSPALQPLEGDQVGVKVDGVWPAIDLHHDFYEVDYLPENDRVRYTIHPDARKEILKRLLLLNHQRYAEEVAAGLHDKKKSNKKTAKKSPKKDNSAQGQLEL